MKLSLVEFDNWENFVIEKQIVDILSNYIPRYTIPEVLNNVDKSFTKIQNLLFPIVGFRIPLEFFRLKNIQAQIRIAYNACNDLEGFICGGDVYYFLIRERGTAVYLEYQWHSLFHELITLRDGQARVRGLAREKLMEVLEVQFPMATVLRFNGKTEGTMKMFAGHTIRQGDAQGRYEISLEPLKKRRIDSCIACNAVARYRSGPLPLCSRACYSTLFPN